MSIIIGIDHGYYAIKTAHCSFAAGLTSYGEHEPYTRQGLLEFGGCFFVCGSGRQPIQRDKTINDNYYLLTLAAIAKEIRQRGLPPECSVRIAAGLPLTSFGRDKPKFRDYLLRSNQPLNYKFEGVEYSITIAQYESGFRTPKESRTKDIAKALNVREENFFTRAETPEDIIRLMIWYDWEHGCGGSVPIDTILLFDNFEKVEKLLKEWYSQKEKLRTRKITGAEYLEWMLQ